MFFTIVPTQLVHEKVSADTNFQFVAIFVCVFRKFVTKQQLNLKVLMSDLRDSRVNETR